MFERMKAIMIVRQMIQFSEELIDSAKSDGLIESNNYANAECVMLALAVTFSNIYTGNNRLGDTIIKESISGSWRSFYSQAYKEEYRNRIENFSEEWKRIVQRTFNEPNLSETRKLNVSYHRIQMSIENHLSAVPSEESDQFFALTIIYVKDYIASILRKNR